MLRRWSFPRSRAEALFECLQQTARIASLKAVNGSSLLACTASPDQRLHSFPICVDVADRLERHGPLFNEAEGQSEFLRADYRRAGAVLTLAPDLRLIEQGMCDDTVPGWSENNDGFAAVHCDLCHAKQAAAAERFLQQGVSALGTRFGTTKKVLSIDTGSIPTGCTNCRRSVSRAVEGISPVSSSGLMQTYLSFSYSYPFPTSARLSPAVCKVAGPCTPRGFEAPVGFRLATTASTGSS